jgi:hypothetical protein
MIKFNEQNKTQSLLNFESILFISHLILSLEECVFEETLHLFHILDFFDLV